jgi:hypothetical protein
VGRVRLPTHPPCRETSAVQTQTRKKKEMEEETTKEYVWVMERKARSNDYSLGVFRTLPDEFLTDPVGEEENADGTWTPMYWEDSSYTECWCPGECEGTVHCIEHKRYSYYFFNGDVYQSGTCTRCEVW